jgi:hypothetical protein
MKKKIAAVTDQILIIVFGDVQASGIGIGIPLALCAIFAILGAKFAGSWGFLAGLTVAVVLCFAYLSLGLWAVVLVGIVDAIALIRGMPSSGKAETVSK